MGTQRKLSDYRLSDYVDMEEQDAMKCFSNIDQELFLKNPTEAIHKAGVITKPGVDFKIIKNESEIDRLPTNVYPFLVSDKLSMDALDSVAGGVTAGQIIRGIGSALKNFFRW
jgi:hypothetical protein